MLRGCIAASGVVTASRLIVATAAATDEQSAAENRADNGENGKTLHPILHGIPPCCLDFIIQMRDVCKYKTTLRHAYKLYFLSEVAGCDKGLSVVLAGLLSALVSVEAPLLDSLLAAGADSDAVDEPLFALLPASFSARRSVT